jgi:hypothetical protein
MLFLFVVFVFVRIEGNHLDVMQAFLGQQGDEFLALPLVHVNHDRPGHPFDRIFAALTNQPVLLPLMRADLEFQNKPVIDSDVGDSELGPDPFSYLDPPTIIWRPTPCRLARR